MAAEGFPVARIEEYAKPCESAIHVLRSVVRALRSSDKHLLTVPRISSTLGDRAFSVAAPTLWNSLPLDIRCCDFLQSFKTLFKTHLYNKVYN